MKTALRAVLAGLLLIIFLTIVLTAPLTQQLSDLVDARIVRAVPGRIALFQSVSAFGLTVFGLAALAGVLSDWLLSLLLPMAGRETGRVSHAFGMAVVFLLGLEVLGSADWSMTASQLHVTDRLQAVNWLAPLADARRLELTLGWPFIAAAGSGIAGYLLLSLLIRPAPGLSRVLREHLTDGEKVLCGIHQTRWKHLITPDSLVATNQRLIVYNPTNLGFTSTIEDYNYIDIANVKINRGWLFCTILLTERFQGNDLEFHDMLKPRAEQFARVVTEQLRLNRSQVPLSQAASSTPRIDEDAIRVLRRRLAAGDITEHQFEQLSRRLGA